MLKNLEDRKSELKNDLDSALMNDESTEDIYKKLDDLERQEQDQERLKKLKRVNELETKIKEQSKLLKTFRENQDQAAEKLNNDLLPELEEKKQEVREVKEEVNKARSDINRFRLLIPDKERTIENLKGDLKELESEL